ncbi:MAG: GAF domain-containing protein [Chitinophagaceae bacterium]
MKKAQLPFDEEVRLAELAAFRILDTLPEKEFDELTELLRYLTGCETVAITFIDRDRQWFKSGVNLPENQTAREIAFCSHTILQKEVMVVEDAREDDRFSDNPLVTTEHGVRFYAGAPIVTGNGHNIGTISVSDPKLRHISPNQKRSMEIISSQVTKLLELRMKNRIIMDKAEELIKIERRTLQQTLREQEKERQSIGFELHENFAQVLAACLVYLNMASESGELQKSFTQKAQHELTAMLHQIRRLARIYNPISLDAVSLEDIIRDYVHEFQQREQIKVRVDWKGACYSMLPETAINFFRIIVQYLQLVSYNRATKNIIIRVNIRKEIHLSIHSDGDPATVDVDAQKISINAILTRVDLCNGSYDLKVTHAVKTVFRVMLPLTAGTEMVTSRFQ